MAYEGFEDNVTVSTMADSGGGLAEPTISEQLKQLREENRDLRGQLDKAHEKYSHLLEKVERIAKRIG